MAEIKGITIQFEGDTVNIDRSIKSLNQSLKGLKSEFKSLDKSFKLDPENLENIDKILVNIENQQKAVNEKLSIYKDELNDLNNKGDFGSEQWLKINAEIKKCQNDLKGLNDKANYFKSLNLNNVNKQFQKIGTTLNKVGKDVENAGKKVKGASMVAASGLTVAVGSAIQFEDAFTGVAKTVDATDEELQQLKKGIRDLALEIPASTTEISAVAEAAGQLGVKTEDVLEFTKVMIGLGNATNLTSDEASTMIAQFANVTGMNGQYEEFASTLVELGNNGASTEKDIMELAQRLSGAAAVAGLTNQEILALAASMANVGINAEAGGTSMSTFISKVETAVASGSSSINDFAKVANMSADEFVKAWESEPAKAIDAFINGLGDIQKEGGSAIVTLQELEIKETRQRDMLLRLANAQGEVAKNVDMANKAWQENSALTTETEKKYGTSKAQLTLLMNQLKEVAMQLGEVLLPVIINITQSVTNFLKGLGEINPVVLQVIGAIMAFVAALSPVLILIGKLITAVGTISTFLGTTGLAGAIGAVLSPMTLLIGVFMALYAGSETFRNGIKKLANDIVTLFKNAIETMGVVIENIKEGLVNAFDKISEKIQSVIEWFKSLFGWIGDVANAVGNFFSSWGDKIRGVGEWVGGLFSSGGYQSGGYGAIELTTNINVNTNREITSLDTRKWALQMVDVINEELGAFV